MPFNALFQDPLDLFNKIEIRAVCRPIIDIIQVHFALFISDGIFNTSCTVSAIVIFLKDKESSS